MSLFSFQTIAYDKQENELAPLPGYQITSSDDSTAIHSANAPLELLIRRYSYDDGKMPNCLYYNNNYYFKRIYHLSNKPFVYIYCLAINSDDTFEDCYYIKLNYFQNIHFKFLQNSLWLQREENIRYLINIIFLIIGVYISYLQLFC